MAGDGRPRPRGAKATTFAVRPAGRRVRSRRRGRCVPGLDQGRTSRARRAGRRCSRRARGTRSRRVEEGRPGRARAGPNMPCWFSPRPGNATTAAHVPFGVGCTTQFFDTSAGIDAMMGEEAMEEDERQTAGLLCYNCCLTVWQTQETMSQRKATVSASGRARRVSRGIDSQVRVAGRGELRGLSSVVLSSLAVGHCKKPVNSHRRKEEMQPAVHWCGRGGRTKKPEGARWP